MSIFSSLFKKSPSQPADPSAEMANWLAHPSEFGIKPVEIQVVHREKVVWIDEEKEIVFHKYKMPDGYEGIGMTGPITFSFIGEVPWKEYSMQDLKYLYFGWYLSFMITSSPNFSREQDKQERAALAEEKKKSIKGFVELKDYLKISKLFFYSYLRKEGEKEQIVCCYDDIEEVFDADSKYMQLPSLFYFIGKLFFTDKL